MLLAQILLILALVLILVGMIMVLLDAFNESFFWGLPVLLLPPLFVPVYSFVKWNKSQARNGFAMAFVGLVMTGVAIYGGAAQNLPFVDEHEIVNKLPTAAPKKEPLPNDEEAAKVVLDEDEEEDYDPVLSTDKDRFSAKEIEPLAPKEDETVRNFGKIKPRAKQVPLNEVASSLGAYIEVTFKDGEKHTGTLVRTTEDSISIEQQTSGGMVSFEYTMDKIQSIVALTKAQKAPIPPVVESKTTTQLPQ